MKAKRLPKSSARSKRRLAKQETVSNNAEESDADQLLAELEDLRAAQVEIEQSQQLYAELFELAPLGYVNLTETGRIHSANMAAAALLNRSMPILGGLPFHTYVASTDQPAFVRHLAQCREGAEHPVCTELILKVHGGEQRHVELISRASVIHGTLRTIYRTVLRDITERKLAELALDGMVEELRKTLEAAQNARRDAEAATKAKDRFLAVLSHELRTPLTPIFMSVQMLSRRDDLPDLVRRGIEMIDRNVRIEANLVDDLLDITRVAHGKLELDRAPMDAHEAISQAVEIAGPDIAAKKQSLVVEMHAPRHRINGDAARIRQVVWNLLKNAAKFTPQEGTIRLKTRNTNQTLIIEVADSGIGIEPEALARIFEPFEQANLGVTQKFGGLGLGLAISKATVEAHEGNLSAKSAGAGKGATFSAHLPILAPG